MYDLTAKYMEIALSITARFSEYSAESIVEVGSLAIKKCIAGQAAMIAATKNPNEETI